ncbi:unnamed protein product [Danaus chrysippus]|uniref:(African queen) hypothetical protein n=1 Tax=Danaus chrysippus TaxID=151541 RepID=A0A8J2MIC4_9NEOP|nr:unnamed protein product [Danaus chrysippus]
MMAVRCGRRSAKYGSLCAHVLAVKGAVFIFVLHNRSKASEALVGTVLARGAVVARRAAVRSGRKGTCALCVLFAGYRDRYSTD